MSIVLDMAKEQICYRTFPDIKKGFDEAVKGLKGKAVNVNRTEIKPGQLVEWFAVWFQDLPEDKQVRAAEMFKAAYIGRVVAKHPASLDPPSLIEAESPVEDGPRGTPSRHSVLTPDHPEGSDRTTGKPKHRPRRKP